ncbi:molybdate ABC transporter substrate-binding protein [Endozoicomonas sp. SCSIO W0465]|uniref:molybdate ABC transporter substrate-binding protein n=1 Tax=Endozoicomonas sp. SCSIO W0465 TaxID=2918516 RepID=UPI00207566A7|nr:molybdate ABC transporter substrate-binding protein [Endozoicomonas sp. SCSIO W0465]USE37906.1 molybdate ABC transporter substrate-binding protein [Endozoicomonas sp. SCSIO W0465]
MLRKIFLAVVLSFFRAACLGAACLESSVYAAELKVAVAANFKPSLEKLAKAFAAETGHRLLISSASTGVLYNQITNGAPFDVFLSADSLRPERLEQQGLVLKGSRHPYALGELVLWSPGFSGKDGKNNPMTLEDLAVYQGRLAIANPATAPYGLAAQQVLEKLGFWSPFRSRLVQGASIQQAWQFVASGNVPVGLVAKAQLVGDKNNDGHIFPIPATLYDPIRQDLVILNRTSQPEAAKALVAFILSPSVQNTLAKQGYIPVLPKMAGKATSEHRGEAL